MTHYLRWPISELPFKVGSEQSDGSRVAKDSEGYLSYGPYCRLDKGRYFAGFYLRSLTKSQDPEAIRLDVYQGGEKIIAERDVPVDDIFSTVAGLVGLDFTVEDEKSTIEVRLLVGPTSEILARSLVIFRHEFA